MPGFDLLHTYFVVCLSFQVLIHLLTDLPLVFRLQPLVKMSPSDITILARNSRYCKEASLELITPGTNAKCVKLDSAFKPAHNA